MNPITFNEPFSRIIGDISDLPLIDHRVQWQDTIGGPFEMIYDEKINKLRLPFDNFRMASFDSSGNEVHAVVLQGKCKEWDSTLGDHDGHTVMMFWHFHNKEVRDSFVVQELWFRGIKDLRERLTLDDSGTRETLDNGDERSVKLRTFGSHMLVHLAFDFNNPHFFLCESHPESRGRSVQWVQARTHYVFIHRTHPANKSGASGKHFSDAPLTRAAHSRRAHFRLLKSDRYKNKGQRIWVKSAWVGPKEWIGKGNQIYKIVE